MPVNKYQALLDWLSEFATFINFDILSADPQSYAVFIEPEAKQSDFIGNSIKQRSLAFVLAATLPTSAIADGLNTSNTDYMSQWQTWVEQKEINEQYPDFGENCSGFELIINTETPYLAQRFEDGTAKYQFSARLNYFEERV